MRAKIQFKPLIHNKQECFYAKGTHNYIANALAKDRYCEAHPARAVHCYLHD